MISAATTAGMTVSRYKDTRFWAVFDGVGTLVCVCVYKKGADEVIRRLDRVAAAAPARIPDPFWDPNLARLLAPLSAPEASGRTDRKENDRP